MPDGDQLQRSWRELLGLPGLLIVLTALVRSTFPTIRPTNGTDASWQLGINTYGQYDLHFGPQLIYTYGPWGAIDYPSEASRWLLLVAALFAVVASAAVWLAFYWLLRRLPYRLTRPVPAAVLATVLVLIGLQAAEKSVLLLVAGIAVAFDYLGGRSPGRLPWVPAAIAAGGALLTQAKFSEGLGLTLVAVVCAAAGAGRRGRRLVEVSASWLIVSALAWLAAGQTLVDYPRWYIGAAQVASGYSEAMAIEVGSTGRSYLIMAVLVVGIGVFLIDQYRAGRVPAERGGVLGLAVITLALLYLGFKEATVQHATSHDVYFYMLALPMFLGLFAFGRGRYPRAAAVLVVMLLTTSPWVLNLSPTTVWHRQLSTARALTDSSYRNGQLAAARAQMRPRYALSPSMQRALAGSPLAVDTVESSIAWAFDVPWRPAPVFQTYVAYTAALDRTNAQAIANAPADQQILRSVIGAINGRNALWDSPRYVLAELCHYRVRMADSRWLLLAKAANRCGPATTVGPSIRVRAGQPVEIPVAAPDQLVLASFHEAGPNGLVRLGRLLDKTYHPLRITANGKAYRIPRALAAGPLVVRLPATTGWTGRFLLGSPYPQLSFSEAGTVTFQTITLTG